MASSSINGNKRKSEGGIIFSPAEERAVKAINETSRIGDSANRKIGKIVEELVEERGGITHGDQTLKRLALHPALRCSEEQLRRCWQYHRFLNFYSKELGKQARKLSYSHHYQLSRLLDIENEMTQQEAVTAMAAQAVNEKFTVTDLQKAVSTHLKSLRKPKAGQSPDTKVAAEPNPAPELDGYEVLNDMSNTMVAATARIADNPSPSRLAELSRVVNRLGFAYVQLLTTLVAAGFEDAVDAAKKVIAAVEAAIDTKIAKGGATHVN